jgi:hypothetical protein
MMDTIVMLNKAIGEEERERKNLTMRKPNLVNNYSIHILDGSISFVCKNNL